MGISSAGRRDQRNRVVTDEGLACLADLPRQSLLAGSGAEADELRCLAGERGAGGLPWLKELVLPGDDEAALACLQVDDESLDRPRLVERRAGVTFGRRRIAEADDRPQEHREGKPDQCGEEPTSDGGEGHQPHTCASVWWTWHVRPLPCAPTGGRAVSRAAPR
jgi:hypothetical protein